MKLNTEKVRQLIRDLGYRRDFVALRTGISTDTLGNLIRGVQKPSIRVLRLLALTLSVEPEELMLQEPGTDKSPSRIA